VQNFLAQKFLVVGVIRYISYLKQINSMKKYEPIANPKELKIEVRYNKGGMNYFTSRNEERGYYLSVTPVERTKGDGYTTESYVGFSGVKKLILPVARQSEKQYQAAIVAAESHVEELKNWVLSRL
jgi:hypothetical protein